VASASLLGSPKIVPRLLTVTLERYMLQINRRSLSLALAVVSLLLLVILVGYAFLENLTYH
jgi:hypothetical protein